MNCQEFNDILYDVLDETSEASVRETAREHLRHCADCRRVFTREHAVARNLHSSLHRATDGLLLLPQTRRNILRAADTHTAVSNNRMRGWRWLFAMPMRPIGAGIAVAVLLLMVAILSHRSVMRNSTPQAIAEAGEAGYVIDVPLPVETQISQLQGDHIVDASISSTMFGHSFIPAQSERKANPL